jgi:hypothetical protein
MHFRSFRADGPGIVGDMTIDDLVLFSDAGPLKGVERAWTAVKKYSLLIDETHAQAIHATKKYLETLPPGKILSENDLDSACLADLELQALTDSNSYLVKSLIFLQLDAFSEYAHKEIYNLTHPNGPALPERNSFNFIRGALKEDTIWDIDSHSYEANFLDHRNPIRNSFAHGDWKCLAENLQPLELTQAFLAVAEHFGQIKMNLMRRGFDA